MAVRQPSGLHPILFFPHLLNNLTYSSNEGKANWTPEGAEQHHESHLELQASFGNEIDPLNQRKQVFTHSALFP